MANSTRETTDEHTIPEEEHPPRAWGIVRWPATFRALRHRNYRYFWSGQMVSLIGTWMQTLAHQWLVLTLVPKEHVALYVGLVGAIGSLPLFLFSLFGGVVADRFDKRRVLIYTQATFMLFAFTLTALVATHTIQLWQVMVIAFLSGTAMSIDMPTRQSFVKDLVGPQDLLNAIALNSTVFNSARIVGPAVAGWLIAQPSIGISGAFLLNGLSFIAVIGGLLAMRTRFEPKLTGDAGVWQHMQEGFRYVRGHRIIKPILLIMAIYSVFGFSYVVLLPIIAKNELHLGPGHLGGLMSAAGAGALASALLIATFADRIAKGRILSFGSILFCLAMVGLSLAELFFKETTHQFLYLLCLLPFVGGGLIMSSSSINSMIQEITPDHLRGRVVSLWAFLFAGFTPLANFYAGATAQLTNPFTTLLIGGLVCLVTILWVTVRAPWVCRQE